MVVEKKVTIKTVVREGKKNQKNKTKTRTSTTLDAAESSDEHPAETYV